MVEVARNSGNRSAAWLRCLVLVAALCGPASANIGGTWPKRPALSTKQMALPNSSKLPARTSPVFSNNNISTQLRGGGIGKTVVNVPYQKIVAAVVHAITATARTCLPPIVGVVRAVVTFYRILPKDALIAQIGLVYCFCGGCYPTLFAAVQAAQHCGIQSMLRALSDLTDQAVLAVEATKEKINYEAKSVHEIFMQTTMVVMQSVDPMKINNACSALYTTWLGVSTVLEKEFARTINYAVTLGLYVEPIMRKVVAPPVYMCVPQEYHQWVPICLGWITKALAMQVAWRIQRVLTASTSAVMGGLMFSRAIMRMLSPNNRGRQQNEETSTTDDEFTVLDEFLGYAVAAAGIKVQLGDGNFNPRVKFPFTLMTWPFEIAENWIQWQITK